MTDPWAEEVLARLRDFWRRAPQPELGRAIEVLRHRLGTRRTFVDYLAEVSGEIVQADDSLVYRWERGEVRPGPRYRCILAQVCEAEAQRMDGDERSRFLSLLVAAVGEGLPSLPSDAPAQPTTDIGTGALGPHAMYGAFLSRLYDQPAEQRYLRPATLQAAALSATSATAPLDSEEVRRREFNLGMIGLTTTGTLDLIRLLSGRAAASHIDELRQITNQFASWYWRMSPGLLLPLLADHQVRLMGLIRTAPPEIRQPLQIMGSEVAVLAGLMAYKRDDLGTARRQFDLGTDLAREAQDGPATAHAYRAQRNAVSSAAVRGGNRHDSIRALSLLDAAVAAAGPNAPRLQLAMLFATRAEERAVMGLGTEALKDIDRAGRALAQAGPPEVGYYDHWSEARLQGWQASVLLYLGQPTEAAKVLEQIVPATPVELVSDRADVLGDLGAAYAQAGEPERAVQSLKDSLLIARQGGIDDGVARVYHVRNNELMPYSELLEVRELDDQLAAT